MFAHLQQICAEDKKTLQTLVKNIGALSIGFSMCLWVFLIGLCSFYQWLINANRTDQTNNDLKSYFQRKRTKTIVANSLIETASYGADL